MLEQNHEPIEIELPLGNVSVDDLEGESNPPKGKYHAKVVSVRRVADGSPHLAVRLAILAGTNSAAVGMLFTERFYLSDKAIKRLAILAHRLGLIGDGDFGGSKTVDWSAAVGRQLIVEVAEEEYVKKDGTKGERSKITYAGFWALGDDRVKAVPRDAAAARNAPAAPVRPKSQPRPSTSADDFSDL
jgi:hypothetical protein